jgi:hypothetical protein
MSENSESSTPHRDELSPRLQEPDSRPPELSLGIRHGADGSTDVHTNARGVPAILAHTHVWVILIVVAGFVAITAIYGWVLRQQMPLQQRETVRTVGRHELQDLEPAAAIQLPASLDDLVELDPDERSPWHVARPRARR